MCSTLIVNDLRVSYHFVPAKANLDGSQSVKADKQHTQQLLAEANGDPLQTCSHKKAKIASAKLRPFPFLVLTKATNTFLSLSKSTREPCRLTKVMTRAGWLLLLELLLHHGLGGNTSVICAWDPQHVVPTHALPPHHCILQPKPLFQKPNT